MRIDVSFTGGEVREEDVRGRAALVIDVIRATSCVASALAAGAKAIYPAASIQSARRTRAELPSDNDALLCGERGGVVIPGFDLGNSPREFSPEAVGGKTLVMTTTNGTGALVGAAAADRTFAVSFLNLSATVREARKSAAVQIVCAGKEGRFSLDDGLCAGAAVLALSKGRGGDVELSDEALAMAEIARRRRPSAEFFRRCEAGRALLPVGRGADLELCAQVDRYSVVAELVDGALIRTDGGGAER